MSASYRQLASISQRTVLISYAALLFIFIYSTLLMPSCDRQPNLFLALLHLVPMLCFLPGMLRHNVRSYVWVCFLSLGYFIVAVGNAFGCTTFINVLGNDSDSNGDILTVTGITSPNNGSVIINDNQTVSYTPNNSFAGMDSFQYTISDGNGLQSTATVTITVVDTIPDETGPLPIDDVASTTVSTSTIIFVLSNDTDGNGQALTLIDVSAPVLGQVAINGDNSVNFISNETVGTETLIYTVQDTDGNTATATVTITIIE